MAYETVTLTGQLEAGSYQWWFKRLLGDLAARREGIERWDRYVDGDQPLALASRKFVDAFRERYRTLPANFMPLVIDAERERLTVQGFRLRQDGKPDSKPNDKLWRLWQANGMDAEAQILHEDALRKGIGYVMVTPQNGDTPLITIEDACETIVASAPDNRRTRAAGLKVYQDDDGYFRANLFLPDAIYRFRSSRDQKDRQSLDMTRIGWTTGQLEGEDWPISNPLGVVPIVPMPNRPRRDGSGRSEIQPVIGNQQAINKIRFDALIASEVVAFPQRWAIGLEVDTDPDTGQPRSPFRAGIDSLWSMPLPSPAKAAEYGDRFPPQAFGQFAAADLGGYIRMIESEVGQMASISRTPYHYFVGTPSSVPPSGESVKSSEAPLVKKCDAQGVHFGEGWEEVMRLAARAGGLDDLAQVDMATQWADMETRNDSAMADAVTKLHAEGIYPTDYALEELGKSPTDIERIREMREEEALNAPEPPAPTPAPGQPVPTGGAGQAQTGGSTAQ